MYVVRRIQIAAQTCKTSPSLGGGGFVSSFPVHSGCFGDTDTVSWPHGFALPAAAASAARLLVRHQLGVPCDTVVGLVWFFISLLHVSVQSVVVGYDLKRIRLHVVCFFFLGTFSFFLMSDIHVNQI